MEPIFTVLPTRWRQKPAGIDKKRNYVTVMLCITVLAEFFNHHLLCHTAAHTHTHTQQHRTTYINIHKTTY